MHWSIKGSMQASGYKDEKEIFQRIVLHGVIFGTQLEKVR